MSNDKYGIVLDHMLEAGRQHRADHRKTGTPTSRRAELVAMLDAANEWAKQEQLKQRYHYVAGEIPEQAYRCDCGFVWADMPCLLGQCGACGSGVRTLDWKPTAPWIGWAKTPAVNAETVRA